MIKDINYWLNDMKKNEGEGFLWTCIEEHLGLRFGVMDKALLIREFQGVDIQSIGTLWRATRDFCYRYYGAETRQIEHSKEADARVYRRFGGMNRI